MTDRNEKFATKVVIPIIRNVAGLVAITLAVIAIAVASYALFDINRVGMKAQPDQYAIYNPKNGGLSCKELQEINPEVFGWIDIYGTNIDYPIVQTSNNEKYLSTDAMGKYSVSGSIFLDYRNKKDFIDFNNIIYGHSMSHNAMFGDVKDFTNKKFYDEHKYGDIFFDNKHHGLRIVGFVETDAYKSGLYRPRIISEEEKLAFLRELDKDSKYEIKAEDKSTENTYVLLSTCTYVTTNGRDILVCVLTDEVYTDPFENDKGNKDTVEGPRTRIRFFLIMMIIIAALISIATVLRKTDRRRAKEKVEENEDDAEKEI